MRVLNGFGVNRGTASGIVFRFQPDSGGEPRFDLLINQRELLGKAIETSIAALETAVAESGEVENESVRMVFESHKLMVGDPLLLDAVYARIDAGESAYRAYKTAAENIIAEFRVLTNAYMRNRVIDIIDATDRVLHAIVATAYEREFRFSEPRIVLMDQMRPSVIRNCHKPHVVGFIAEYGAYDQHSSLIARVKELPGVIVPGALQKIQDGDFVTIDGTTGTVVVAMPTTR